MTGPREWLRTVAQDREAPAALVPAAILLALFGYWASRDGGYSTTVWLPSALLLLALLVIVASTRRPPASRTVQLAVCFLALFTAFNFASIAWAGVRGDAWDGANRALLYLVVFTLVVWLPWTPRTAALALGTFSLVVAAIALQRFLDAASNTAAAQSAFIEERLATPITYANASAALLLGAAWPAAVLGARRETIPLVRGLLLAAAVVCTEIALMCQSRGSLVAAPIVMLAVLGFAPSRLRLLLVLAAVALPVGLSARPLLHVYRTATDGSTVPTLTAARTAVLASAAGLFVFGVLLGLVDRRVEMPRRVARRLGFAVAGGFAIACVAGTVTLVESVSHPLARIDHAWTDFKHDKYVADARTHLSAGVGSNRYDIWRVALVQFRAAPVGGAGSDNYAAGYLRLRRTQEEPLYPHSLELQVLEETGVVGGLLFAGFLAAALTAAARALRQRPPQGAAVAAAALAGFAYWIVHGSVDWFWEIPALGGPALAWLALTAALGAASDTAPRAAPRPTAARMRTRRVVAGAVVAIAGASLTLPWLAAREVERATAVWSTDHAAAYAQLDLARKLNPLSDAADVTAGVIAARTGDGVREREAFSRALERNPSNWYPQLELAVLDASEGNRTSALKRIAEARALDPREPVLYEVQHRLRHGMPVSQHFIEESFAPRFQLLTALP